MSAVSSPTSVGMAPSRALLYKVLLRAANEAVPPQRREEGEPPPRRAASIMCPQQEVGTPPAPPTAVVPPTPIFVPSDYKKTSRVCSESGGARV
eukprot:5223779-Pyramimonas_sp.AAC.1